MGNLNCCCSGCCCCHEESPPVRSRSSSSNPDYYGRRIRLWPPNSGDPEQEPSEDSTKVIMVVVPCDYSEEEDQGIDEVDSTAPENLASGTLMESLPQQGTNEEDQSKAEGDAGRCGNGNENGVNRMHVIDLDAWNTRRYDSTSEEEDLEDHTITVIAEVHAEFSSSDSEDVKIETTNENVDAIALENLASETMQDSVPQSRTNEEESIKDEVDEGGSTNYKENELSHVQVTDLHDDVTVTTVTAEVHEEPSSDDSEDVERDTTNENEDAGGNGNNCKNGLSQVQEDDVDVWNMQEYDWTSDEEDTSDGQLNSKNRVP
ncbi:uncharacterized protein RHO17_026313 isoform 2-T2 [Thomomys bottae]